MKLGPQELPALSDLFCPNLIGADQPEKGRSRNLQELTRFSGCENLVFCFHLELSPFLISVTQKTGLLLFSESPVIPPRLCVFLATRLTRPWVPWLSVPPLQVVWHYLRLCFAPYLCERHANWFKEKKVNKINELTKRCFIRV